MSVMTNCPLCNSEIPSDSPAMQLTKLSEFVKSKGGWEIFETDHATYGYPVGKQFNVNGWTAKVVAKKVRIDNGDIDKDYWDGELPQGTTFEAYVVIQVGENNFFKKTGTGDSSL
jgi:hypothetical protein